MKNDKKIERKVAEIQSLCSSFLSYTNNINHNNSSDNILLNIIKRNEELKELYRNQDTEGKFRSYLDFELNKNNISSTKEEK